MIESSTINATNNAGLAASIGGGTGAAAVDAANKTGFFDWVDDNTAKIGILVACIGLGLQFVSIVLDQIYKFRIRNKKITKD
jgi:hypothetical protein